MNYFRTQLLPKVVCLMLLGNLSAVPVVIAQTIEWRVDALEEYVATFQPTLLDFSQSIQNSIDQFTSGLETNFQSFTKQLQMDIEERIRSVDRTILVINPSSPAFQRIETNTGSFLVSVNKLIQTEKGYRLYLNIGNPNYANYKGFKIKFFWGQKFHSAYPGGYAQWRESLKGAEYMFEGGILKGQWNPVELDIDEKQSGNLVYMEMEMDVLAVELQAM